MKKKINDIFALFPADYGMHAVRDLSVLTASVFAETYAWTFEELFGLKFSSNLWAVNGDLVNFYRSQSEHDKLAEVLGQEVISHDLSFSQKMADKLIADTDWINNFIAEKNTIDLFLKSQAEFIDRYRAFFAYHQAVYWAGDYASKILATEEVKAKVNILQQAYQYNELVVPDLEKYFRGFGVNNYLHDELGSNEKFTERFIGILFIGKDRQILNKEEMQELEKLIESRHKVAEDIKELKGVIVGQGHYEGKVKLIKDLNKLDQVEAGDVLVTSMTRPQFNSVLKNVGALVTDDGGALCHAAILAREFNIPTVVGTKIATKVLKDGDMVEVDADKGIVRIIK
jgi:phosphohistidine swiveling domain-containing protein